MSSDMRNVLSVYTRYSVVRLGTRGMGGRGSCASCCLSTIYLWFSGLLLTWAVYLLCLLSIPVSLVCF